MLANISRANLKLTIEFVYMMHAAVNRGEVDTQGKGLVWIILKVLNAVEGAVWLARL